MLNVGVKKRKAYFISVRGDFRFPDHVRFIDMLSMLSMKTSKSRYYTVGDVEIEAKEKM
jgi:hypothetical protein